MNANHIRIQPKTNHMKHEYPQYVNETQSNFDYLNLGYSNSYLMNSCKNTRVCTCLIVSHFNLQWLLRTVLFFIYSNQTKIYSLHTIYRLTKPIVMIWKKFPNIFSHHSERLMHFAQRQRVSCGKFPWKKFMNKDTCIADKVFLER